MILTAERSNVGPIIILGVRGRSEGHGALDLSTGERHPQSLSSHRPTLHLKCTNSS